MEKSDSLKNFKAWLDRNPEFKDFPLDTIEQLALAAGCDPMVVCQWKMSETYRRVGR